MFSDIIARQTTLHNRLYLENRIYFKNERSRVRNPHSWGARRDEDVYSFLSLFQGFSSVSPLDLPWRRRMPIPHLLSVLQRLCEDPSLWSPFLTSWHQPLCGTEGFILVSVSCSFSPPHPVTFLHGESDIGTVRAFRRTCFRTGGDIAIAKSVLPTHEAQLYTHWTIWGVVLLTFHGGVRRETWSGFFGEGW